jgi:hypothetical protein
MLELSDIDSLFASFSETFTNWVRETGNSNHSRLAVGTINHYATCINATWSWLALPVSLALLSLLMLFATICTQKSNNNPFWKSNVLAFIFHSPGGVSWQGLHISWVN